ncbi:hypothetical protein GW17_00019429 [Ensete ventricosum]|nr:hypothetical protein GW17_00019429 [Ensete ventricosum]
MDSEVVTKLQRFNARRKLRAAAIASVLSSKVALRTKKLKSLLGSNDLTTEEIENLRLHFKRICANGETATLLEFEEVLKALKMDSLIPLASRALPEDCLPADITEPGKLDEIFDQMDANSDGKVTFEEFEAAMHRNSSLQDVVLSSLRPV